MKEEFSPEVAYSMLTPMAQRAFSVVAAFSREVREQLLDDLPSGSRLGAEALGLIYTAPHRSGYPDLTDHGWRVADFARELTIVRKKMPK